MSDERFANLETIVSFHEDTIQKLGDVVYRQQLKIDKLEEKVESLTQFLHAPVDLVRVEREPKPE
jgi:uncharacterized coiled-coil protein SlyX